MPERIEIDYGHGLRLSVPAGMSVLEASLREGIEHANACGGWARCTTCRVEVEEGAANCPPPAPNELQALRMSGLGETVRLACQLRPTGAIRVRILIPTHPAPPGGATQTAIEQEVAALFTDIRGFTTFAETRLPFDVREVLNRYFDMMGVQIERHEGRILSYLGDGIVSLFLPIGDERPAARAVACALDMRRAAYKFGGYVRDHFDADLRIGTAVHLGLAVVGDLGYYRQRQFNATGAVLNVAARLEELNKEYGTDILISDVVRELCADQVEVGRDFELTLRGRAEPIRAWEVLGGRASDAES